MGRMKVRKNASSIFVTNFFNKVRMGGGCDQATAFLASLKGQWLKDNEGKVVEHNGDRNFVDREGHHEVFDKEELYLFEPSVYPNYPYLKESIRIK